MKDVRAV